MVTEVTRGILQEGNLDKKVLPMKLNLGIRISLASFLVVDNYSQYNALLVKIGLHSVFHAIFTLSEGSILGPG